MLLNAEKNSDAHFFQWMQFPVYLHSKILQCIKVCLPLHFSPIFSCTPHIFQFPPLPCILIHHAIFWDCEKRSIEFPRHFEFVCTLMNVSFCTLNYIVHKIILSCKVYTFWVQKSLWNCFTHAMNNMQLNVLIWCRFWNCWKMFDGEGETTS